MESRRNRVLQKLEDANKLLRNKSVQGIVSIKFHEITDYGMYKALTEKLRADLGLKVKRVSGNFSGKAWLVTDKTRTSVILVEHETGLEILYIAGSIASLLSLIPAIGWYKKKLQNRFGRPDFRQSRDQMTAWEISRKNKLIEREIKNVEAYLYSESMKEITTLSKRVKELERENSKLEKKVTKQKGNKRK